MTEYLIVTTSGDYTAKSVADWLKFIGKNVRIFYADRDDVEIETMQIGAENGFRIQAKSTLFDSGIKRIVYFRRGMIKLMTGTNSRSNPGDFNDVNQRVRYFFTSYEIAKKELIDHLFSGHYVLGKDNGSRTNKIVNLQLAHETGLNVPDTIITTQKKDVIDFFQTVKGVITKSFDIGLFFGRKQTNQMYQQLTSNVKREDVTAFPETFPLTVFQEKIQKILELRVFYLGGKIWTSAILSQNLANTLTDYRNYNPDKMNRVVPYELPDDVASKIHVFMDKVGMKIGSIDLIVAENEKYYFLEVNPGGQFTGFSDLCNFNLELQVAQHLIENE